MNEELEELQKIGAQKIHEQTHIPFLTVQSIIHGSYEGFSRMQFLGFISILEREYKIELSVYKEIALAYFDEELQEKEGIFIVPPKRPKKNFLLFFALLVFMIAVAYKVFMLNESKTSLLVNIPQIEKLKERVTEVKPKLETNTTQKLKESVIEVIPKVDINATREVNTTQEIKKKELKSTPKLLMPLKPLKIISKSKVWFGYINVKSDIKHQKTFKGKIELDSKKTWLLLFGHGYINIYVDGKLQKFPSHPIRFLYKNGLLKPISAKKFKDINRGQKW